MYFSKRSRNVQLQKKTSNLWFISGTPAIFLRYFSRHAGNGFTGGTSWGHIFKRQKCHCINEMCIVFEGCFMDKRWKFFTFWGGTPPLSPLEIHSLELTFCPFPPLPIRSHYYGKTHCDMFHLTHGNVCQFKQMTFDFCSVLKDGRVSHCTGPPWPRPDPQNCFRL